MKTVVASARTRVVACSHPGDNISRCKIPLNYLCLLVADPGEAVGGKPTKRRKLAAKPPVARKKPRRGAAASYPASDSGSAEVEDDADAAPDASRVSPKAKRVTRQAAAVSGIAGRQGRPARFSPASVFRRKSVAVQQQPDALPVGTSSDSAVPSSARRQRSCSNTQPAEAGTSTKAGRQGNTQGRQQDVPADKAEDVDPRKPGRQRKKANTRKARSQGTSCDAPEREDFDGLQDRAAIHGPSLTMAVVGGQQSAAGDASSSHTPCCRPTSLRSNEPHLSHSLVDLIHTLARTHALEHLLSGVCVTGGADGRFATACDFRCWILVLVC